MYLILDIFLCHICLFYFTFSGLTGEWLVVILIIYTHYQLNHVIYFLIYSPLQCKLIEANLITPLEFENEHVDTTYLKEKKVADILDELLLRVPVEDNDYYLNITRMEMVPWQLNCEICRINSISGFSCNVSAQQLKLIFYQDKFVCNILLYTLFFLFIIFKLLIFHQSLRIK